ncbi:MAG: 7-cyano-7-deazaguanine synthase QueC [Nitrospirota bacterium]
MSKRAVVLLSGGVDSATAAALAKAGGFEVYALSFDYAQRHRRELESAKMVAESLGVSKHLVIAFDMSRIGGSALTADMEVPKDRDELSVMLNELKENTDHASRITHRASPIPVTYVPARNTIFLSFALGWAEVLEAADLFIGANAVDYSGYPDCRPEYLEAFERMANLSTRASVEGRLRFTINAPLLSLTKGEIIKKGAAAGLDYALTWSCYDPQEDRNALSVTRNELKEKADHALHVTDPRFIPCGRCDSCIIRAKGFKEAGMQDPLIR